MAISPVEFYNEVNKQIHIENIAKEKIKEMDKKLRKLAVEDKPKGSFVVVYLSGLLSRELRELISQEYINEGWPKVCSHILDFKDSKSTKFILCRSAEKDYAKGKSELNDYLEIKKELV
jgi:hypothetical protein